LLGTLVDITAGGLPAARLQRAVERAFAAVERVQALLSFHDPESDLSRINRRAHREPVRVHPLTWAVLRHARALARSSGGRFDAAVAPRLQTWGLLPRGREAAGSRRTVRACGSADILLIPGNQVRFPGPLILDLGGMAKGYAVDRAVSELLRAGVTHGCVNAGGDLRAVGRRPVPVRVRHPSRPGVFFPMGEVIDGAMATSALTYSGRRWRGRDVGALVDPRTGAACGHGVSITVWARPAWLADALTKVVAGDPGGAAALMARHRARAVVIDEAGLATWIGGREDSRNGA
jgi:thiamine biosynthesis lipoprotein